MAITLRYDNPAQLLEAAKGVGQGQAFARQQALDQQTIANVRQYYAMQDQQRLAADQQALQAAMDRQRSYAVQRPSSTPMSTVSPAMQQQQQQEAAQTLGLTPEDQARLTLASQYGDRSTISKILQPQEAPASQSKVDYVKNVVAANDLSPEEAQGLQILASAPDVTMAQLRTASDKALKRRQESSGQLSPQYQTVLTARQISSEINSLQRKAEAQAKQVQDKKFNPNGPASQFSPEFRPIGGNFTEGLRNLADVFLPGQPYSSVSTGGNADAAQLYNDYQQTLAEIKAKQAQYQQVISGTASQATPPTTSQTDVSSMSTADLLRAALGG